MTGPVRGQGRAQNGGEIEPFDVCGPLPSGVTVLEASAGTGKTFTIAALAARYVADGWPLERLLLVTFTRMATGELRERVRERLVAAEQGLARAAAGVEPPPDDTVLRLLATGAPGEIEERRRRLAGALADFDAATIATTHGFCQHILSGLGVAGDVERDATFLEDPADLVDEVVADLYVRGFHARAEPPPFNLSEALRIGRTVVGNPGAALQPQAAPSDSDAAMRLRFACAVRAEVEQRKRRAAVLTYEDLLTRLAGTLADPLRGPAACRRLRERYRVALVDEFQDTDPVQWEIMRRGFGGGDATLVLIGDPKQAIYAFRGADVYAYLDAARLAGTRATLAVNWRSDQGLVDAYGALFGGAKLGHRGIAYRAVHAAAQNQRSRLAGAPDGAPLRIRVVHRGDGHVRLTPYGWVKADSGREHVAADVAADIVRLLSSGAEILARSAEGIEQGRIPVRPGHVAVLVRRHRDAAGVRDSLARVGVPAVINGAGSVFATGTAREWLRLFEALERPAAPLRARSAALTVFIGWTAERLATADDRALEDVHARLHRWAGVLRRRGVAALLETITVSEGLPGRVLARDGGERELTDLRHVGQLLHGAAQAEQLGATALTAWLRQRIAEAAQDTDAEERSRRLESDAEAVQVLTIHRSKGLEFPVVYCPYLWDPGWIPEDEPPVYHDAAAGDRRTIDVGGEGDDFGDHWAQHVAEQRGEDLRLAYVALTRAQHQAVVWWAASWDARNSPLSRLLFCRDPDGTVPVEGGAPPDDDEALAVFGQLAGEVPGAISVERTDGGGGAVWAGGPAVAADLSAGRFDRALDPHWRRTSYSRITAGVHEERVASEPEEAVVGDEALPAARGAGVEAVVGDEALPAARSAEVGPDALGGTAGTAGLGTAGLGAAVAGGGGADGRLDEARLRAVPSLLGAMPGGVDVGTLIHAVLERTDFAADDLNGALREELDRARDRRHLELGDPDTVVAGLTAAICTPLGPLVDDLRLRDVGTGDRLDELDFELPLAGGDAPTATVTVDGIAALLRRHLPPGDPLEGYADRLVDPALDRDLRGYLAGSLDLVVRTLDAGGDQRFAVVDYKTNWLGVDGEELSAWHYRPAALADAMHRAHYPLQALLYTVALHRYLRWRLPGYTADRNLAGVLYLFVRGMTGATAPRMEGQPCGVFAWRPAAALVEALSDLLDRGAVAA